MGSFGKIRLPERAPAFRLIHGGVKTKGCYLVLVSLSSLLNHLPI